MRADASVKNILGHVCSEGLTLARVGRGKRPDTRCDGNTGSVSEVAWLHQLDGYRRGMSKTEQQCLTFFGIVDWIQSEDEEAPC